jgi:hypothetical protein
MFRGAIERAAKIIFSKNRKLKNGKNRKIAKRQNAKTRISGNFGDENGFRKMKNPENFSNRLEPRRAAIDPITEMAACYGISDFAL